MLPVFIIAAMAVPIAAIATAFYFVSFPERSVQAKDYTPSGLRVILVDFPGDPNIVAFDSERVSTSGLQEFANAHCRYSEIKIEMLEPTLLDQLRGEKLARFIC